MKKLLIFMLVLGMTSAANATIEMAVDGVVVADTTLESFTLSAELTSGDVLRYDIGFKIIGAGAFDISAISFPSDPLFDLPGKVEVKPGYELFVTQAQIFSAAVPAPATLVTGIGFSGGVQDQTTIEMWDTTGQGALIGTLPIVPEPMTIALLGLGGLFLLRRRK